MNIVSKLNENLLRQPFLDDGEEALLLAKYQQIACGYSAVENSIAVLSDLKSNKSYIYHGGIAQRLGLAERNSMKSINSIWEEDIFSKIHPDDLMRKHSLELQFFHLLKTLPAKERSDYHVVSNIQMKDRYGDYIGIQHRMFYVCSCPLGNLWLALCLYNYSSEKSVYDVSAGRMVNAAKGCVVELDRETCDTILSHREKEVLLLIDRGKMSKDIADSLSISINTVNRHRQNILEKLQVKNSIEACRIARLMGLF